MTIDQQIAEASQRVQALIDERHDRLQIRNRFAFEHMRRANGQRLRNDKREQKRYANHLPR